MKTRYRLISRTLTIVLTALGLALCIRACTMSFKSVTAGSFFRNGLTLIIDAGHGGIDGGAAVGEVRESIINLSIALKLDNIMGLFGETVVLTRDREDISYPNPTETIKQRKKADQLGRVELINSLDNAVLISIHQNKFTSTRPYGAQVFYSKSDGSEQFALTTQALMIEALNPENTRLAKLIDNSIYLMRSINCPAILVECGFMSNPDELKLLLTDGYQLKISVTLAAAYLKSGNYLEEVNGKS